MQDCKIGKGEQGHVSTNMHLPCNAKFSQNSASYWITTPVILITIIVMKDTDEGQRISALISAQKWETLDDYVFELVGMHVSSTDIICHINAFGQRRWRDGKKDKETEIKHVLNIY